MRIFLPHLLRSVLQAGSEAGALAGQIEYPAGVQGGEAFFVAKDAPDGSQLGETDKFCATLLRVVQQRAFPVARDAAAGSQLGEPLFLYAAFASLQLLCVSCCEVLCRG